MDQPKYMQVIDYLQSIIDQKEPHTPIPSEREISQALSMSRMTVRRAVEELCQQGVLYRDGNKGTFISGKKPQPGKSAQPERKRILYFDSIYDSTNVREVSKALFLPDSEHLFRLVRLILRDQIPLRVEEIYAASDQISDEEIGQLDSFLLLDRYRQEGSVTRSIEPMLVPAKYCRLMQLRQNTPILRQREVLRRKDGRPFLFVYTYFNPETSPFELYS